MGIWKIIILIVFLCGLPGVVQADDTADSGDLSSKTQAIEYFKIGVSCFDEKDFKGALVSFQKAYDLNPSWKLFYNIAHCQAALKMYGLAVITFERYLAEGGDVVPESRRDEVLTELERMRPMVGDIEVAAPDGLDVYVDDIHRGTTPLPGPLSVSAGLLHQVDLVENGEKLLSVEKIVRGGTTAELVYDPYATIDTPTSNSDQTSTGNNSSSTSRPSGGATPGSRKKLSLAPFIVATGATVLLGGATATLAILVNRGKENMKSESDASKLNNLRKAGIGTLIGTAGAGITAAILAAFTDFKGNSGKSPVSFYATPSEGGLIISGSF